LSDAERAHDALQVTAHAVWAIANDPLNDGHADRVHDTYDDMPTLEDLRAITELVEKSPANEQLYVRWSLGPAADLINDDKGAGSSHDSLTGVALPGLSANPLAVEPWWTDRPLRLWIARRLYDYQHLRDLRGPGVRPWILVGEQGARGPDNEPLVRCLRPVAWICDDALREARNLVDSLGSEEWGPLDRRGTP
jgi:hypothetical protein